MFLKKKSQNLFKKPLPKHLNKIGRIVTTKQVEKIEEIQPVIEDKKEEEIVEQQEVQQAKPATVTTKKKTATTKKQEKNEVVE